MDAKIKKRLEIIAGEVITEEFKDPSEIENVFDFDEWDIDKSNIEFDNETFAEDEQIDKMIYDLVAKKFGKDWNEDTDNPDYKKAVKEYDKIAKDVGNAGQSLLKAKLKEYKTEAKKLIRESIKDFKTKYSALKKRMSV